MLKHRVLVIDDDYSIVAQIARLLGRDVSLQLVGSSSSGADGIEKIRNLKPEIVLLDLFMPGIDGMEVMARVREDKTIIRQPEFIVLSAVTVPSVIMSVLGAGAKFYIVKPFDEQMLLRRLHMAAAGDYSSEMSLPVSPPVPQGVNQTDARVRRLLREVGVAAHLKGYTYLVDAIMMTLERDPGQDPGITKVTYPAIARMNQTTASRVERAMRHAIEVAWEKGDAGRMYELIARNRYSQSAGGGQEMQRKPTNSEFIACAAGRIRELG